MDETKGKKVSRDVIYLQGTLPTSRPELLISIPCSTTFCLAENKQTIRWERANLLFLSPMWVQRSPRLQLWRVSLVE